MIKQFLHFQSSVGRRLLCVDEVVEVIPMVSLQTEFDGIANENFCGLLNFRGKVVPAFDLCRFEKDKTIHPDYFLIIASVKEGMVAVVAFDVDYLINVEDDQLNTIKATNTRPFMVAKINEEMVRVLDVHEFLK